MWQHFYTASVANNLACATNSTQQHSASRPNHVKESQLSSRSCTDSAADTKNNSTPWSWQAAAQHTIHTHTQVSGFCRLVTGRLSPHRHTRYKSKHDYRTPGSALDTATIRIAGAKDARISDHAKTQHSTLRQGKRSQTLSSCHFKCVEMFNAAQSIGSTQAPQGRCPTTDTSVTRTLSDTHTVTLPRHLPYKHKRCQGNPRLHQRITRAWKP